MRRRLDRAIASLVRTVLRIFFRRVEIEGLERLPRERPLLVVANHGNALVDPLLIVGFLPVTVRFLAKSTLWDRWILRHLLKLGGAIPVFRRQDEVDTSRNVETFERCHQTLRQGGAIALFPEGLSHDEPALAPLRTGGARIVLEAEEKYGPLGTRIVPVGLVFDAKERFRSRVLIQVGEAVAPGPELGAARTDPAAAVRRLTDRIQQALETVTLNYDSWREARLIERAADLFARSQPAAAEGEGLTEQMSVRRAFARGYRRLRQTHPREVAAVVAAVERYDRLLRAARLRDDQVASRYPLGGVVSYTGRAVCRLLLGLPLALVGTALNWLPYRAAGWIASRFAHTKTLEATYKLLPSLVLFPATWGLEAVAGWLLAGTAGGLAVALLTPLSGYVALIFHEDRERFWEDARAYLLLRTRSRLAAELRQRRRQVAEAVGRLVALYREGEGGEGMRGLATSDERPRG